MFHDALTQNDHGFFSDLSEALLRRKDPAYADRFKAIDYFISQLEDVLKKKRGPIERDELKALGISNVSRTLDELGLSAYIKKHTDRQGKREKKNTK